jgi:hypothetical protein
MGFIFNRIKHVNWCLLARPPRGPVGKLEPPCWLPKTWGGTPGDGEMASSMARLGGLGRWNLWLLRHYIEHRLIPVCRLGVFQPYLTTSLQ